MTLNRFRIAFDNASSLRFIAGMIKGRKRAEADARRREESFVQMQEWEANFSWEAGLAAIGNIMNMLDEKERLDGYNEAIL